MPHDDRRSRGALAVFLLSAALVALALAAAARGGIDAGTARTVPRIVRVVCTDHICGNCDGACHRESGHVAIDKKGHCACTPTEGGALDGATREAYAKDPPK
jgi:hypothetical protein